jgi:hypothetical protein
MGHPRGEEEALMKASGSAPVRLERVSAGRYRLTAEVRVDAQIERVFPFFADARNLNLLTPPWLDFVILTPLPIDMKVGTLIDYRLRIHRMPLGWKTRISAWEPPHRFVDEQIRGPYRLWRHEHAFSGHDGETVCRDTVDYAVAGGELVHRLLVKRDVDRIFGYRSRKMVEIFGGAPRDPDSREATETGSC